MKDGNEFFSPVMKKGEEGTCGKCKACRQACPVKAVDITVTGANIDRVACMAHVKENDNECFDCLLACKYNVLVLRKFKFEPEENTIIQIDKQ